MTSKKDKVYAVLKSRRWITSAALNKAAESDSGPREARRLREDGYTIKSRRGPHGTEYRIA